MPSYEGHWAAGKGTPPANEHLNQDARLMAHARAIFSSHRDARNSSGSVVYGQTARAQTLRAERIASWKALSFVLLHCQQLPSRQRTGQAGILQCSTCSATCGKSSDQRCWIIQASATLRCLPAAQPIPSEKPGTGRRRRRRRHAGTPGCSRSAFTARYRRPGNSLWRIRIR